MSGMWDKFRARRRLGRRLTLWYHPRYEAPSLARLADSLGMIALRGKRILAQLAQQGLVKAGDLRPFPLVSLPDLALFHSQEYLEKVGHRAILGRIFGIPDYEVKVDEILGSARWAVSGTVAATRSVLQGPAPLAVNLGGGFHHSEPEMGSGFCVYNDIGVAIHKARREGFSKPAVIVDLDFHQGNGNIVGFLDDPTVHTYSLHGAVWTEREGSGNFNRNLSGGIPDTRYLEILAETLPAFLAEHRPGLAFYIAGHDVLRTDPLGEFNLSLDGALRRDRMVMDILRRHALPAVVTLGGGYSPEACQAALNLATEALGLRHGRKLEPEAESGSAFRKLLAAMEAADARRHEAHELSLQETDLWPGFEGMRAAAGAKSAYEIERELESSGLLDKLRNQGFEDFRVSVAVQDAQRQKVRVAARPREGRFPSLRPVAEFVLGEK